MKTYKHISENGCIVFEPSCTENLPHTGHFIYYYDIHLRLWTVIFHSDDNVYVSDAGYYNNKEELLDDYPWFKFKEVK
jgi:hypothetical protein